MPKIESSPEGLYWETEIPVSGNRFILGDLSLIFVPVLVILVLLFGGIIIFASSDADLEIVALIFGIIAATVVGFFILTLFLMRLIYGKSYRAAFSLDDQFAIYRIIKKDDDRTEKAKAAAKIAAGLQGQVHYGSLMARHEANKTISWDQVAKFKAYPDHNVIALNNKLIAAVRLYCPDNHTYELALEWVRQHVGFGGAED